MKNRGIMTLLIVLTVVFAIAGGTLAYFTWRGSNTAVTFTVSAGFSCGADGGGNITSSDVMLAPSSCINSTYAIKREIKVMPKLSTGSLYMNLWLNIDKLDTGLANSQNFNYVLSTSSDSCDTGVVASGNFYGMEVGDKVNLFNDKYYSASATDKYYLYIWLDQNETSTNTMNQSFSFSLGGDCTNKIMPSVPTLDYGMIPVTISNDGTVTVVSETSKDWYDYDNKQWANVVLVDNYSMNSKTAEASFYSYEYYKSHIGTTVSENDILAYFVWIPRYKYRMSSTLCSELDSTSASNDSRCYSYSVTDTEKEALISWWKNYIEGLNLAYSEEEARTDVQTILEHGGAAIAVAGGEYITIDLFMELYNSNNSDNQIVATKSFAPDNSIGSIDVIFESKDSSKSTGDAVNEYYTHPAFTFGTSELSGIWVGKFETTGVESDPLILPNDSTLTSLNVSRQFKTALNFAGGVLSNGNVTFSGNSLYGLSSTTDSHMMKNSEWGAVAYLSHSKYGINSEVRINNYYNSGFLTGCGASEASASSSSTCDIPYGEASSYPQSTTGNISGVFDMSGGAWEYVMGNYGNYSGYNINNNSGFNGMLSDGSTYSGGVDFPPSKYYDLYSATQFTGDYSTNTNFCTLATCGGHALSETAWWYSDYAGFVSSGSPWFVRGGYYYNDVYAGAFSFDNDGGSGSFSTGFRVVLSS